jgi:hypothetical protein
MLNVLSKEISGLKNDLSDFTSKMVCKEDDEDCMMSRCQRCKRNFIQHIIQNVVDKKKIIKWYQWTTFRGRVEKTEYSGKNKRFILSFY